MSKIKTFPLYEKVAFHLDTVCMAHIALYNDMLHNNVPDDVQKLVDDGRFTTVATTQPDVLPEDYTDPSEIYDIMQRLDYRCILIGNATGEIMPHFGGPTQEFEEEEILYLPPLHELSYYTKPYDDINDIVDEFKRRLKESCRTLPDDFDYKSRICVISGTHWC